MRIRGLLTLFFILSQTAVIEKQYLCPDSFNYALFLFGKAVENGFGLTLGWMDLLLICLCLMVAFIQKEGNNVNEIFRHRRIGLLRIKCLQEGNTIERLAPFIEDCRNRNTKIEISLIKVNRGTADLLKNLEIQLAQLENLSEVFNTFKAAWIRESQSYPSTEAAVLKCVELAKILSEIASLKDYIGRELNRLHNEIKGMIVS